MSGPGLRIRYGRLAAVVASAGVTLVASLTGLGLLVTGAPTDARTPGSNLSPVAGAAGQSPRSAAPDTSASARPGEGSSSPARSRDQRELQPATALPARSGQGRRAVFSESRQRVWLVGNDGRVLHTYPVSGSIYENLEPGSFRVWSRSRHATGIDDSGTMQFFVRFAHGDSGAAIGFHDIPVADGELVQSTAQLGTPRSHGCIRQRRSDAIRMWHFAQLGDRVVVTA